MLSSVCLGFKCNAGSASVNMWVCRNDFGRQEGESHGGQLICKRYLCTREGLEDPPFHKKPSLVFSREKDKEERNYFNLAIVG